MKTRADCRPAVQVETGNPYMLYKDNCNRKSNQQNLVRRASVRLISQSWRSQSSAELEQQAACLAFEMTPPDLSSD